MLRAVMTAAIILSMSAMASAQEDDSTADDSRGPTVEDPGSDYGNVRIHSHNEANTLAESTDAQAFTHGNEIQFDVDNFEPGTRIGKAPSTPNGVQTVQPQSSSANPHSSEGGHNEESENESETRRPEHLQQRDRLVDPAILRTRRANQPDEAG